MEYALMVLILSFASAMMALLEGYAMIILREMILLLTAHQILVARRVSVCRIV
jgi:hypothetical protein